jgi:multiple sugar transport system permease protein
MPGSRWRPFWLLVPLAAFLWPLFWLVSTSLRPVGQPLSRRLDPWPAAPEPGNYAEVFSLVEFGRFALNSLLVAAIAVPVTVLVASWAGFALAQLPARPRMVLVAFAVAALMVPVTAIWLPRFILFDRLGLLDSRLALIAPSLAGTSPFFVLVALWGFLGVPAETVEAARLDGAGAFRAWWGIALPQALPATAATAVLAFVATWGNFIDPLLYIQSMEKQTLPYGLQLLHQLDATNWPLLMAAAAMATAPPALVFLVGRRWLLRSRGDGAWFGR